MILSQRPNSLVEFAFSTDHPLTCFVDSQRIARSLSENDGLVRKAVLASYYGRIVMVIGRLYDQIR